MDWWVNTVLAPSTDVNYSPTFPPEGVINVGKVWVKNDQNLRPFGRFDLQLPELPGHYMLFPEFLSMVSYRSYSRKKIESQSYHARTWISPSKIASFWRFSLPNLGLPPSAKLRQVRRSAMSSYLRWILRLLSVSPDEAVIEEIAQKPDEAGYGPLRWITWRSFVRIYMIYGPFHFIVMKMVMHIVINHIVMNIVMNCDE